MSRIEGVPEGRGGPPVRVAYALCKREYGDVVEPLALAAHHPQIMSAYGAFEWVVARANRVDRKLKGLAETKVAALAGCEFCMDIATSLSRKAGVTREQLQDLPRYRDSEHFNELEKLVLDYAVAMTRTPVEVSDELFDALRRHFTDAQLVELTTGIAIENYRARWNWAFGIGSQGFVPDGEFCVRPEPIGGETLPG